MSLLIVAVYSIYAYRSTVDSEMKGVDQTLLTAAYAARQMVGENFHDQLPDSNPNSQVTTKQLTDFARDSGLAYAYSTIQRGGRVLYTSSSASPNEVKSGQYQQWFLAEYKDVPAGLAAAFNSGSVQYEEYQGEFGLFRSVFVPFTSARPAACATWWGWTPPCKKWRPCALRCCGKAGRWAWACC
ncbi:hypothetical protein JOS77_27970 [Chromobacterium haemolyticum]|nr:hypothetical protein JOS77_27970 [Chromobacterium haemolyticum]